MLKTLMSVRMSLVSVKVLGLQSVQINFLLNCVKLVQNLVASAKVTLKFYFIFSTIQNHTCSWLITCISSYYVTINIYLTTKYETH